MDFAFSGHDAARRRLADLATLPGAGMRMGAGYLAVRTGFDSDQLNGVVSGPGFVPDEALVRELLDWFDGAPARWLAAEPDAALATILEDVGFLGERTGQWCGRRVRLHVPARGVERVAELEEWTQVARACGWGRRPAYDPALRPHWVARREGRAVGIASAWPGEVCELVDLTVLPDAQRTGVGTELVQTVLAWAAGRGASYLVAAPSPDGWALLSSLGFEAAPMTPGLAYYLPVEVRPRPAGRARPASGSGRRRTG